MVFYWLCYYLTVLMSLPLHSWVSGMPYRVEYLREVLDHILAHDGVWTAPVGQIAAAVESQI